MGDVVRILVADDHPLTRDGIKAALSMDDELEVVAEACNGQEAVSLAESVRPDVVLMDVRMPVLGGIRATRTISRTVPSARVVMLTVEETQARVGEAIQAGRVEPGERGAQLVRDVRRPQLVYVCMEDRPRGELVVVTLYEEGEEAAVPREFTDLLRRRRR